MKKLTLSLLIACITLLTTNIANACSASCTFGSCVTECAAGVSAICGCEFGIAVCKCGDNVPTKTTRAFNQANISLFNSYASSVSVNMVEVGTKLGEFDAHDTNADFQTKLNDYENAINSLSDAERELFNAWISAHPGS